MTLQKFTGPFLLAALLGISACASPGNRGHSEASSRSGVGIVNSVEVVNRDDPSLVGTIAGGVLGGVLGHQIGGGRGQTAATVAGAVGGAIAGREVEKRVHTKNDAYRVEVRMDDGSVQTFAQETNPNVRAGDRVRVENGIVTPY
jgi:outer membrane lipoprotein SlyB